MKSWCHTLLFYSLTWMKGQIIFLPFHTTQQIVLSCTCGLKQDGCRRQSCERLLPSSHWPVSHTEYLNLEIPAVNNWLLHRKSEMLLISVTVFKSGMWHFLISPGFAVLCLLFTNLKPEREKMTSFQWQSYYYITKRHLYINVPIWLIQVLIELEITSQCTVPLS